MFFSMCAEVQHLLQTKFNLPLHAVSSAIIINLFQASLHTAALIHSWNKPIKNLPDNGLSSAQHWFNLMMSKTCSIVL